MKLRFRATNVSADAVKTFVEQPAEGGGPGVRIEQDAIAYTATLSASLDDKANYIGDMVEGSLRLGRLTEELGLELKAGKEYLVTITEIK